MLRRISASWRVYTQLKPYINSKLFPNVYPSQAPWINACFVIIVKITHESGQMAYGDKQHAMNVVKMFLSSK